MMYTIYMKNIEWISTSTFKNHYKYEIKKVDSKYSTKK